MLPPRDLDEERAEQRRKESWDDFHAKSGGGRTRFEMYGAMPGFVMGIFSAANTGNIFLIVGAGLFGAAIGWILFWVIKRVWTLGLERVSALLDFGYRRGKARERYARQNAWRSRTPFSPPDPPKPIPNSSRLPQ